MTTKRTVDIITEAFSDVMSNRRKYELELPNGKKIELYFPPVTRYDRQRAQTSAGSDDALMVSTQLLCQLAQNEDGSKAFALPDAINLQRMLPEKVLNDIELFLFEIKLDLDTAKKD
tara:strand:- start:1097 stop:1447 length:351 start_codon:yes stop_codon:yes gene_type:complete